MDCSMPGFPVLHYLLEFFKIMSIESVMPFNHLILCRPLLLLPSIFLNIRVFSNESALHIRWPKCWNFSFSISPSNEYWGLISFKIDLFDLLAVQETLKSLLQHHNLKAWILQCSAFFMVLLSHLSILNSKIIALSILNNCWQKKNLLNLLKKLFYIHTKKSQWTGRRDALVI